MRCWVYVVAVVAVVAAVDRNPGPNMNGLYSLSPSGGADPEKTKNLFPKNFKDYPGAQHLFPRPSGGMMPQLAPRVPLAGGAPCLRDRVLSGIL